MHKLLYVSTAIAESGNDIANIFSSKSLLTEITGMNDLKLYHKNSFVHVIEGDGKLLTSLFYRIKRENKHNYTMIIYDTNGIETSCYQNKSEIIKGERVI